MTIIYIIIISISITIHMISELQRTTGLQGSRVFRTQSTVVLYTKVLKMFYYALSGRVEIAKWI